MFDIEKNLDDKIFSMEKIKPTVIFSCYESQRVIAASLRLLRVAKVVLLAPEDKIARFARHKCTNLSETQIEYLLTYIRAVDIAKEKDLHEEFAQEYVKISKGKKWEASLSEARKLTTKPPMFSIMAVKLGYADMAFGGLRYGPQQFFRPSMQILTTEDTPFEAGIFVLPEGHVEKSYEKNIAVFGDVAVNSKMTAEKLADIAVGTCKITRDIIPEDVLAEINAAIVSYSTKGLDEGPSVDLVRKAAELVPGRLKKLIKKDSIYSSINIVAEVQISCAVSREAAVMKLGKEYKEDSPIGQCNVVIAPNLDLGNFLYNSYAIRYPLAKKFPVSGGLKNQVVDFSKESTETDLVLGAKANILGLIKSDSWEMTPLDYFFPRYKVLSINPGSTSTKFTFSEGDIEVYSHEIRHNKDELAKHDKVTDQYNFRKNAILDDLKGNNITFPYLDAVVGRGGLIWPVPSGTFVVNERMKQDLLDCVQGSHASNLGGLIASEIAAMYGAHSFIIYPVVVDEVDEVYKITGFKEIKRKIISHALNQIATAKRYAESTGRFYREVNVIVAHMGGGISIGAHCRGKYLEVNNALDGEGPFTPERSGSLPVGQLIRLCYSGKYTRNEMKLKNKGRGGLVDLLGTSDFVEIEKMINAKNEDAVNVFEALAYQIARWISSLVPAFEGETVDQVLLTGGLARSKMLVDRIKERINALCIDVCVYPGENEMLAMREGVLRVLMGKEKPKEYMGKGKHKEIILERNEEIAHSHTS